jgi:tetratricopeptide (TPR) repeat protein
VNSIIKNKTLLSFLLIAAFAFVVYISVLGYGFVRDDLEQIVENTWMRSPANIPQIFSSQMWGFNPAFKSNYYRPFIHLIYMAVYFLFGAAPWGFHLANLLFHSLMSGLVFLTARELMKETHPPSIAPVLAGLLFAAHPIHTEPVAWASAISELSFSFFFLLSFYLYIKSEEKDSGKGLYAWSVLSFAFSVLCKETGMLLPFVLIVYEYALKKKFQLRKYMPHFGALLVYLTARTLALRGVMPVKQDGRILALGPFEYLINAFYLFIKYIEKLLLPINLNGYSTDFISSLSEPRGFISLALAALFLILSFIAYKKEKKVFFALAFLSMTLLPALYIRALYGTTFAERYLYLPSFGFVLLFAFSFKWAVKEKSRKALYAGLLIIIGLYSWGTIQRLPVWKDNVSYWTDSVAKNPESDYLHTVLGFALMNENRLDEAQGELNAAIGIDPENPDAHCHLGAIYGMKGMNEEAVKELSLAERLDPSCPDAHFNLAVAYANLHNLSAAIEEFKAALKIDPDFEEARAGLAEAYRQAGISTGQ